MMVVKRFPVEESLIRIFAHAIGDENPVYVEERAAHAAGFTSLVAPPTFVEASRHFDPDSHSRLYGAADADGTALHAEQHYEYHRALCAGDVLTATVHPGRSWQKEGRRSGTLHFVDSITEYRDQHGELVVTSRMVGVRTSRPVDQAAP
jgi:acyl dehydratase